jgi:hypothetical protein
MIPKDIFNPSEVRKIIAEDKKYKKFNRNNKVLSSDRQYSIHHVFTKISKIAYLKFPEQQHVFWDKILNRKNFIVNDVEKFKTHVWGKLELVDHESLFYQ